jgi:hypothetical protein
MRFLVPLSFALVVSLTAGARAEQSDASSAADSPQPVQLVVHGGSVSAYRQGGYAQWLPAACKNIEVKSVAQEKLSAAALRHRFVTHVLRSASIDAKSRETWLVFLGGLNSINSPEWTNLEVSKTLELAHGAGFRTLALTFNPWGSEGDTRWRGGSGLEWFAKTQLGVDFLLGRLTPAEAFGEAAATETSYRPGQLPEIAIDLWDSALRNRNAPLRARNSVDHLVRGSSWVKARLKGLEGPEREAALEDWITRARALPQWFLRPELIGSDPVHPNSEGHKEIARAICARAPASWGCNDCSAYDGLVWHDGLKKPVPR